MAQMMSKMGCHRRLLFGSPAKSLGLRVCHRFCTCVRQSLSSLQHPEPEKAFSVSFHSVQPLPNSHNKSIHSRALSLSKCTHLFSHLLHAVSVIPLHFISSTASATHTCRWYHSTQGIFTGTIQPTASFSYVIPSLTKTCAKPLCILHRSPAVQFLPISVFHPRSTRSRLATFQSYLLSLASQLPENLQLFPCCLAPRGSAQGCFTS